MKQFKMAYDSVRASIGTNCVQQPCKSSAARTAREKALQEIRISLQPFAHNERPTSSASSTSDSSSSPGQTSGIGSSVSSNYSQLDLKEDNTPKLLQILQLNGYSEESAINYLKTCNDRSFESTLDSLGKEYKLEFLKNQSQHQSQHQSQLNDGSVSHTRGQTFGVQPNGSQNLSLIGQIPIKSLRKSSVGENLLSRESTVNGSCGVSSRSDSPGVSSIANLHRDRLLPDQPRILNSNGLPLNEVHYHSSVHGLTNGHSSGSSGHNGLNGHHPHPHPHHPHFHHHSVTKRISPNYLSSEPPPPLPPPRGTIAPPPPPLSASPTPSSSSSNAQIPVQNTTNTVNNSASALHQQLQHILPNSANPLALTNGVHVSSRPQAYSYASSASSSSPQRGTSPVSFINGHSSATRTMTNCAPNMGVINSHLAQQLQNMGLYSSNSNFNSSNSAITPQLYAQSPVSFSSICSPPPSYAASSSSGRQSPTSTIGSSSDYASVPPQGLNNTTNLQLLHNKKPSPVSSTSSVSSLTPTSCPSSSKASNSFANRPSLQAWTARQAVSQSPVIMQSVKSTQVQKPVLQTAIAPSIPAIGSTSQIRTESVPPPVPPPNYQSSAAGVSNQLNTSSQMMTTPPPYMSSVQKSQSRTTVQESYPANPPPSYATAMQQQQQKQQFHQLNSSEISVAPQSPPPPPLSQPPPPPPYTAPKTQDNTQYVSVVSNYNNNNDFNGNAVQVPTTEPPSYASSVAALAAQRAAINNLQQTNSSYNTRTAPAVQMPTRPPPMPPSADRSDLVNTVESICNSQVSALQGVPSGVMNTRRLFDVVPPLPPKPNQLNSDVTSIASSNTNTDLDSDASVSTASTSDRQKKSHHKTTHQSPIPPRKNYSIEKEQERRESKVKIYSPAAFKFFMEQHIENVLKSHTQRERRRQQLESEMAKVGLSEEDQSQMRKMLQQKESNYLRLKRAKMDRSLFTKIKTIGVGAFGEVALVKKIDANQLYAMKTLRKSDVLKRNQVAHVKAERDILAEADNEWVVKLYYSFQDSDHLYFVMDYIPGGDLMSLLIKFGIFKESLAKFYIAEMVLAVESVHKMGFIHRDIKPDNILIDSDGHIKLTDFGLCTGFRWTHNSKYYQRNNGIDSHDRQDSMDIDESWGANNCHCYVSTNMSKPLERRKRREHQRCLAHSLVGTPNYIAPEVLMRTGYTQLCDWWSVGVILYEMIVGQPPFFANTPEETQNKVIHFDKTLRIPKEANLSVHAADLIMKLCCGPEERIGKNGVDEIKRHQFFENIDFEGGLRKQPAPYIPEIKHPTDTSNFDPIDTDKLYSNGTSNGMVSHEEYEYNPMNGNYTEKGKHPEHAFFEFTFRRFFDAGGQAYPMKQSDSNSSNNTNDNGQGSPVYV